MSYRYILFYKNNNILIAFLKYVGFVLFSTHPFLSKKIKNAKKKSKNGEVYIFIHLPKTGGTYLNSVTKSLPVVSLSHSLFRDSKWTNQIPAGLSYVNENRIKKISNKICFTILRNPLEYLVSYWNHVSGSTDTDYKKLYFNNNHYDLDITKNGFVDFVDKILSRNNYYPSNRFLYPQLFDSKGTLVIDYIFFNKNLDLQFENFFTERGYMYNKGEKKRKSPKIESNSYYNNELMKRVKGVFRREYFLFNSYYNNSHPVLLDKKDFQYNYDDDILYIKGKAL